MNRRPGITAFAVVVAMLVPAASSTAHARPVHARAAVRTHASKIPLRCKTSTKSKGSVVFSDWQFPDTLNPAQSSLSVTFYVINALFDGLFTFDQHAKLVPQMATKVPTVKNGLIKNNGKTVIIKLKKGLIWSNGAPITSQDIKFGLAVGKTTASGPVCTGTCDVIGRIDTPDAYTAILHLKHVYAPVLAYGLPPIYPHKWSGADASWNNNATKAANTIYQDSGFNYETSAYPTNGAYQVASFVRDDRIVFKPWKRYNDMTCGGRLKQLVFSFYSSKPGMIAAAANNQIDITGGGGGYTPADLDTLRQHANKFKLYQTPSFTLEHLEFNVDPQYNGKTNPLSNLKVRQALALSLDKIGLIRSALGITAKDAQGIAAWSYFVHTPKLVQPFADKTITGQWDPFSRKYVATGSGKALADARKLLKATPYSSGFSLELVTTPGNPVRVAQAGVIAANWKRLGVNLTVDYDPNIFHQYDENGPLHRGAFQVGMFGVSGLPDPDQGKFDLQSRFIDRTQSTHGVLNENYSGIHDKAIDNAFNAGAGTVNNKARAKAYATIQREVNQKAFWIGLYYRPNIATRSAKVRHFINNPTQIGPTWNIYDWSTNS